MRTYNLKARDLLAAPETPHYHAFRISLLVAVGQLAIKAESPFEFTSNRAYEQLTCRFWPDAHLVSPQVHTVITMRTKDRMNGTPAFLQIETEYTFARHRRQPSTTIVHLPDELLGVSLFDPDQRHSTYTGLFWNLTPGEVNGNLFDIFELLASAYAHIEGPLFNSFSMDELSSSAQSAAA